MSKIMFKSASGQSTLALRADKKPAILQFFGVQQIYPAQNATQRYTALLPEEY